MLNNLIVSENLNSIFVASIILETVVTVISLIALARSFAIKSINKRVEKIEEHYVSSSEFNNALAALEASIKEYIQSDIINPISDSIKKTHQELLDFDNKYTIITKNESDRRTTDIEGINRALESHINKITEKFNKLNEREKTDYTQISEQCRSIDSRLDKYNKDSNNEKRSRNIAFRSAIKPLKDYFDSETDSKSNEQAFIKATNPFVSEDESESQSGKRV